MDSKRIAYFDILNIIACISVVVLHSNGAVHQYVHDSTWWMRVFYEVVFYFAVPIFFMLSGATLLRYQQRYDTKTYIHKRIHRAFIPFLFFSLLFMLLEIVRDISHGEEVQLLHYFAAFCTGKLMWTNYWFFIPLFLLYIFIPFVSQIINQLSNNKIILLAVIIISMQTIMWPAQRLMGTEPSHLPMDSYVAYLLLGGVMSKDDFFVSRKWYFTILIVSILSLTLRYVIMYNSYEANEYIMTYNGLWAYFPAVFIFLFSKKHFGNISDSAATLFKRISSCSFGVYLIHGFVLTYMSRWIDIPDNSLIHTAVIAPATYISCLFIVSLIKRFRLTSWMM